MMRYLGYTYIVIGVIVLIMGLTLETPTIFQNFFAQFLNLTGVVMIGLGALILK